jgi:hypothetical protein
MVSTFRGSIDSYARLPEEVVLGQISEIVTGNVELFARTVLEGRDPLSSELEAFRSSARVRAAEGMQLEDLLHAYRVGGRLTWRTLAELAEPGERDGLLIGAELLMRYIDTASSAVAQAYLDARQHAVSEEERRLRDLLAALCGDDGPLMADNAQIAARLRIPVVDRYRPFGLTIPGGSAIRHGQMAAELRAQGILALTEGDRVSGLLAEGQEVRLPAGGLLAVESESARGMLKPSLERARLAIDLARRLGRTGELALHDLALELMLASSPEIAGHMADRVLAPLRTATGQRAALEDTLSVFVEAEGDRRTAATLLHIHPNTLDYRLRRIEELSGVRLGSPRDLAMVVLALTQRRLRAQPASS